MRSARTANGYKALKAQTRPRSISQGYRANRIKKIAKTQREEEWLVRA